jgi:hypothetical protein
LPVLLDAEQLADYMLIIFYTGGYDTGISRFISDNVANNWFGIYNRVTADQGFQFFIHDNEHSLGAESPTVHGSQNIDRTGPFNNGNQNNFAQFAPPFLHQDLLSHPEYKQLFIDRVQKFMFNGGALTSAENIARFMERKNQVDPAIIAEAARWGDSKVATPYNKTNWQNEINWIVNTYFPSRGNTVISQLRADGLYSASGITPPTFSQHGGLVLNNYPLTMTSSAGTIYYTTDGVTDPRLIGGAVNPAAAVKQYTGGVPISGPTTVMARLRTAGGQWSGLVEATFSTVTLAGDYNGSGLVDQNDFNVWRSNFGAVVLAGSGADGNANGVVDAADYSVWRDHLGATLSSGAGALAIATEPEEVEPDVEVEVVANQPLMFVSSDSLPTSSAATPTVYSRRTAAASRSEFNNLLVAAMRPAASPISEQSLDFALDSFASSDRTESELLAVLAADIAGMPDLLP